MALHTITLTIEMEVESDLRLDDILENIENELNFDFTSNSVTDVEINNSSVVGIE